LLHARKRWDENLVFAILTLATKGERLTKLSKVILLALKMELGLWPFLDLWRSIEIYGHCRFLLPKPIVICLIFLAIG